MDPIDQQFIETPQQMERFKHVAKLSELIKENAEQADQDGEITRENIQILKDAGYTAFTVPKEFGGEGISLYEFLLYQEKLAQGDAAATLSVGWHLGIIMDATYKKEWKKSMMDKLFSEVVEQQVLINTLASEAKTGSPARGGVPGTIAKHTDKGWLLNGRKTFGTMVEVLDYILVTAKIEGTDSVSTFLIPKGTEGTTIIKTWNTIAMRGTGSHDLELENVLIPHENRMSEKKSNPHQASGWLLHIPACYMGIAIAARNDAVEFAASYSPNSISGTIKDLPNVRSKIAEIDLEMMTARNFMYNVARKWDNYVSMEERKAIIPELAAVKSVVTNTAISIVDKAMRVVGAHSLYLDNPLQRYYRDVRAGLHNPPADDATYTILAKRAFNE